MTDKLPDIIRRGFASKIFFRLTMVWFALQAGWLALTGLYPMAFDENYHFGLIRLYSTHLLPFWSSQPPGNEALGAFSRDPSYLYHYSFGFLLRIIQPVISSQTAQIVIFRFLNIALFMLGLWLFRKVLVRAGCSAAMTNFVLAMVVATPVVSLLAAQINYDNLLFAEVALTLLYLQKVIAGFKRKKLLVGDFLSLIVVSLAASITKYAFLPIDLALAGILVWAVYKYIPHKWTGFFKQLKKGFKILNNKRRIIYIVLIVILGSLCLERYAVNTVRYKTPTPECDQVLSIDECIPYSPWRRNYLTEQDNIKGKLPPINKNPVNYTVKEWLSQMTYQLFFAIDGASHNYLIGPAFRLERVLSLGTLIVGMLALLLRFKEIMRRYSLLLLAVPMMVYLIALLAQNYLDFIHIGFAFAIQGRYLVPFLPVIYALAAVSISSAIARYRNFKSYLAALALITIVSQAGGAGTYILRSNSDWYWPNKAVIKANQTAQRIIHPIVIGD